MDNEFIKNILTDTELADDDCKFLADYLEKWLCDSELNVDANTIKMLNKHSDNIERLKTLYCKNKIMDVLERKITLSKIANGDLSITRWKSTKDGPYPIEEEPSFSERINAIQVLNALDQLEGPDSNEHQIIIDDIHIAD